MYLNAISTLVWNVEVRGTHEKRFLREATPVMRGDSGASKYSSERISSGVNTN
jgi:hypothetical protein